MGCVESLDTHGFFDARYGHVSQDYDPEPSKIAPPSPPIDGAYKALSVGINYYGSKHELGGCITDCRNYQRFLERRGFFPSHGLRVLTDDGRGHAMPTKQNIVDGLKWLVEGAQPGHSMFFHYSGHGLEVPDDNGDEANGFDEAIAPMDFRTAGVIRDDQIIEICSQIPPGSRLTAICDCCHSGTMMDLPWCVVIDSHRHFQWTEARSVDMPSGHIILLSGCTDSQKAADVRGAGALSHAFMETLDKYPELEYGELLERVRKGLRRRLGRKCQVPQLSCSHRFDLQEPFHLGCDRKDREILLRSTQLGKADKLSYARSLPKGGSDGKVMYPVGSRVEAWFYTEWFPATIRLMHPDGTYDVDWDDGTATLNVHPTAIRAVQKTDDVQHLPPSSSAAPVEGG